MPGIVRVKHRRDPYVVIDRRAMEDERLSWAARGLFGYLLSKPDDWQVRVSDLRRRGDPGRDAVRRLLQHLQEFGYVTREQSRDAQGRVTGIDFTVHEVPEALRPDCPAPARPGTGLPAPDEPAPPDAALPSNQITKYPVNQVTTTTTPACDGVERGGGRKSAPHVIGPGQRGGVGDRDDRGGDGRQQHRRSDDAKFPRSSRRVDCPALEYPRTLSELETAEANRQLAGLPVAVAQQLIDELAGRMATGGIRGAPLAYLRGLIARAAKGAFTPEAALSVAAGRERRRRGEFALARVSRPPELPPADENHPLVKRALRIRDRALSREDEAKSSVLP